MPPKFKCRLNDIDGVPGSMKVKGEIFWIDMKKRVFLGPCGPKFGPQNDKIRHVQNQVDEVTGVIQENITKVIERRESLDELQDKSESLLDNTTAFSNRSKQLQRQMVWMQNEGHRGSGWSSFSRSFGSDISDLIQ